MTIISFLYYAIRMGTPLLFATTGEIITERSGSLNLGVEGMMAFGAIVGYIFACYTNSLLVGLIMSFIAAAFLALIYAFLTVTLQANQTVTGLALTIFGNGVYLFIGRSLTAANAFPSMNELTHLKYMVADNGIPVLRNIPYLGKLLFSYNIFVYMAVIVALLSWVYLSKTKIGLKVRATGENPGAADACGVNVTRTKYLNIIVGGGICGWGGLYLAMVTNGGTWNESWINGMGWIAVALVIFANWSPLKAIFGSYFFGMFNILLAWKGNLSAEFPTLLGWLGLIPNEFYQLLPFLITAVVLVLASANKRTNNAEPASLSVNYYREER
ncbi:MAG: ABC transporter permease [Clostridia bacterium]|nr:ABC transporter permease [Clostridia bacterium]